MVAAKINMSFSIACADVGGRIPADLFVSSLFSKELLIRSFIRGITVEHQFDRCRGFNEASC
jgi:hypothetical protein